MRIYFQIYACIYIMCLYKYVKKVVRTYTYLYNKYIEYQYITYSEIYNIYMVKTNTHKKLSIDMSNMC